MANTTVRNASPLTLSAYDSLIDNFAGLARMEASIENEEHEPSFFLKMRYKAPRWIAPQKHFRFLYELRALIV